MPVKLLRVTQLDAVSLDKEIYRVLKNCIDNGTKYLPPGFIAPYEPEINLILKLLVLNYSIIKSNRTFGQNLFLIRYENLTAFKKMLFVLLSCMNYIKDRAELWNPAHKINKLIDYVHGAAVVFQFINVCVFLRTGSKPTLIDRILGLNQVYSENFVPRQIGSKYLTREILWHSFAQILLFVLPLINYHRMKRIINNLNPFRSRAIARSTEKRVYNAFSRCPHCKEPPIQPHHMGCAHVFCYICLKGNQLADSGYECVLCGFNGKLCQPVYFS